MSLTLTNMQSTFGYLKSTFVVRRAVLVNVSGTYANFMGLL